jgi:serine/threonine protein kinase
MLSIAMESYVHETLSHPNLIFQLDKLEEDDQVTFVLPYMSGGDLLDAIAPEQGLPRDMAVLYSKQLLTAVAYLHGNGLAHRHVPVMYHHYSRYTRAHAQCPTEISDVAPGCCVSRIEAGKQPVCFV